MGQECCFCCCSSCCCCCCWYYLIFKVSITGKDLTLVLKVFRMTGMLHTHRNTTHKDCKKIYEIKNLVWSHLQSSRAVCPLIGCIQHRHAAMSSRWQNMSQLFHLVCPNKIQRTARTEHSHTLILPQNKISFSLFTKMGWIWGSITNPLSGNI